MSEKFYGKLRVFVHFSNQKLGFLGEILPIVRKNGDLVHSFYKTSWKISKRRRTQKNGVRSFKRVLATLVLNISEAGWVDSAGDWVINWDWVFTNIEFTSQKKKLEHQLFSWKKTAYFKISKLKGNVYIYDMCQKIIYNTFCQLKTY